MLWGGVSPDGELRLDPAFLLDVPASMPDAPGPYRLEGVADDGARLFALDFEMGRMSKGGGGFVFMVPFRPEWLGTPDRRPAPGPALSRIVLTGPEGTATLDRETHVPMAIVMDRATGQIRAILRGEDAEARIAAMSEPGSQTDAALGDTRVAVSYGLPRPIPK